MFISRRARYAVAALLLSVSACSGNRTVPATDLGAGNDAIVSPAASVDTTSVLKTLNAKVTIGSTVDSTNGDKAPHALLLATASVGKITKGQIVTCNFSNKAGAAGQGTTVETLAAKAGSKAAHFSGNAAFKGCAGLAVSQGQTVYGAAFDGKSFGVFSSSGTYAKMSNSAIVAPFSAAYASTSGPYPELLVFATDASTGSLLRIDVTNFPSVLATPIATGFAVNKKPGASALGPSGLAYNKKGDTLYVVDGVTNTVVALSHVSEVLLKNALTIKPGGKTFGYAKGIKPFASLVYAGGVLKSPVASTLLPNGNLIVANTTGNALVELTPAGTVLDTKVVDTSATPGVFGLAASGTTDANTVLYFTDANSNTVEELTK